MTPDSSKRMQVLFRFMLVISAILFCIPKFAFPQLFWIESFNTTCTGFSTTCTTTYFNSNNPSPNGTWGETAIGSQGSKADVWFVSDAENGNAVLSCGTSGGGNGTLHVANVPCGLCIPCPSGDCAAKYNAGGFGSNTTTDKRVESPIIDCSGKSNITLSFKWIGKGQFSGGLFKDYCDVVYSSNGGTTWSVLQHGFTGLTCPGSRGKWACFQMALPASANNNSNVKIGFEWVNNNDLNGADPSFAVDDVMLSVNGTINSSCSFVLPIELVSFHGSLVDKTVQLNWLTASEINNNYFLIERSADAVHYDSIGIVRGAGTSIAENNYSFADAFPNAGTNYYRLRQVDYDGSFSFSNAIGIRMIANESQIIQIYSNPSPLTRAIVVTFSMPVAGTAHWLITDLQGMIRLKNSEEFSEGLHSQEIPINDLSPGCYLIGFGCEPSALEYRKLIVY